MITPPCYLRPLGRRRRLKALLWALMALVCTISSLWSDGTRYPLPEEFSTSVIVGKRLKNPFAAKLRLSQSKVENAVTNGSARLEQKLKSKLRAPPWPKLSKGRELKPSNKVVHVYRQHKVPRKQHATNLNDKSP